MALKVPSPIRRFILAGVALVLLIVPATAAPQSPAYDSFYVFGDSLADVGNIFYSSVAIGLDPPIPPSASPHRTYNMGRFSNGPVAVEYLWEQLTGQAPGSAGALQPSVLFPALPPKAAVGFAFGGTGVGVLDVIPGGYLAPGLRGQVESFGSLLVVPPSPHALYAIVTGANEYGGVAPAEPQEVVDGIVAGIRGLYGLGARNILVAELPDLSVIPVNALIDSKFLSKLTRQHNLLLKHALHDLGKELPAINLIDFDFNGALKNRLPKDIDETTPALDVFYPPDQFPSGFRMSLCIFNAPTCHDVPTFNVGLQYRFWDAIHPTTGVHKVLGEAMYEALIH